MFENAYRLIKKFKGEGYLFGEAILKDVRTFIGESGKKSALIISRFPGCEDHLEIIRGSLQSAGVSIVAEIDGAGPNAPREDLFRIADALRACDYDLLVSFGGGSTIDAAKAADILVRLGGEIDDYFGTGKVTARLEESGRLLTPHIAIQTAASSGAHLTKYSNITDTATGQKKLIVDEAIVPEFPVFDYLITHTAPPALTLDGALDGIAHSLEVLYGAVGKESYPQIREISLTGIELVVNFLPRLVTDPSDSEARQAICMATDLGGYAIMVGGTNGGHLTSFSLVDVLSHGRACALLNPYYTVFFAPAIADTVRAVGKIFKNAGYIDADLDGLTSKALGVAVAQGMFRYAEAIGFPTRLEQVENISEAHITRALAAAKDPQLKMKLENMPVPLTAGMIDVYMGPVLRAAMNGDLSIIKTVS